MKRSVKRLWLWIPLFLLITLMGLLGYILFTEPGLRWVFDRGVQWVPGKLSAGKVQGRLIGPLEFQDLFFSDDSISVSIETFKLDWAPSHLFLFKNLKVSGMGVDGVRVETLQKGKNSPGRAGKTRGIHLPVGVILDKLLITDFSFRQFDNPSPVVVNEIFLEAQVDGNTLNLKKVRVKGPNFDTGISGTVNLKENFPMDLKITWTVRLKENLSVEGSGSLGGSLKHLVMTQEVRSPFKGAASINIYDLMEEPGWEGSLGVEEFLPQKVNTRWPEGLLKGQFQSKGNFSYFNLRGAIQGHDPLYVGDFSVNFLGNQNQGNWDFEQLILTLPKNKTRLNMKGNWVPHEPQEPFKVEGSWNSLVWPILGDEADFKSPEGNFKILGSPENYGFQIETSVRYGKIPAADWNVSGNGNLKHLSFLIRSERMLEGSIQGDGQLNWDPRVEWEVRLDGKGFNPGGIYPEWPGKFNLTGSAKGFLDPHQSFFELDLHSIKGDLRGRPVGGKARMEIKGDQYSLPELALQSGTAHLSASGTLRDRWDVSWNFNAKNLGDIFPQGEGSLHGKGEISGFRDTPKIITLLEGEALRVGSLGIQGVVLNTQIDTGDGEESRIDLGGKGFTWGPDETGLEKIDEFSLKARGKMKTHELSLEVSTPKDSVRLFSKGNYHDKKWAGHISNAEVVTRDFGKWFLQPKSEAQVSRNKASTSDLCWAKESSRICFKIDWDDTVGLHGTAHISNLPLGLFKSLLPPGWALDGTLNGRTEAFYRNGLVQSGGLSWRVSKGLISLEVEEEKNLERVFREVLINGTIKENDFSLNVDLLLNEEEYFKGHFVIPALFPFKDPSNKPLQGRLNLVLKNLEFLPVFFPEIRDTRGRFKAEILLSGNLSAPDVEGTISLVDGEVTLPRLGVTWQGIQVSAESQGGNVFNLNGQLKSGEGSLRVKGDIHYPVSGERLFQLNFTGDRFEAIKVPEVWIVASPDLEVRGKGEELIIQGEVNIPQANIEPKDLSGSVQVSPDVVLVGEEEKSPAKIKLFSKIRFNFGDEVKFEGFGLKARFQGGILVREEPEKLASGAGEIQIFEGRYKAYGQELEIERGRLIFTDSPLDNPGLDIQAVRKITDITAGVNIGGRLKDPQLNLFSNPSMEQADILSYIILGRPIRQASTSEGKELQTAATTAGIAGGGFLAQKIGSLFGLEQVEIEKAETPEETALFIGKYLSPRIFLAYGVGLFEPTNTFRVRYQIGRQLFFQTEHGVESGADLLFQVESSKPKGK